MSLTFQIPEASLPPTRSAASSHHRLPGSNPQSPLRGVVFLPIRDTPYLIMKFIDLTGQKFGRLTVLRRAPDLRKGFPRWECLCECGNTSYPYSSDLKSKGNKSCGCTVPEDLTGQVFGRLTAIRRIERPGVSWWKCRCECGVVKEIRLNSLKMGHTKSCGCLQLDSVTTHGCASFHDYHSEYWIWCAMVRRTTTAKESAKCYKNYRGRGITVCERWRSFENFIADMGLRPSDNHTLERVDNDAGYSKENCRWATRQEQARNRRSNRLLEYRGETKCLTEWVETFGLPRDTVFKRLELGWTVEHALETPIRKKRKNSV